MNDSKTDLMLNGVIPCNLETVNDCLEDINFDIEYYSGKLRLMYVMRDVLLEKKEILEEKK